MDEGGDDVRRLGSAPLPGDLDADVCIVGGGLTGLWTAYYLTQAQPELSVVVLEREFCGYGASGRNGGWLSAEVAAPPSTYLRTHGEAGVRALHAEMRGAVEEVLGVLRREGVRTLVEFRPETGRTHQIRVHALEGLGSAVVGDPVYGRADPVGMLLHAARLVVPRAGHTINSEEPAAVNAALAELFSAAEAGRWLAHKPA